eukprot:s658_g27.t1
MVAILQESGDQYLFGADSEGEENAIDFGEDRDELTKFMWDDEDLEHAPTVSQSELDQKARTTPELAAEDDNTAELTGDKRSNFATAVGILLYMSGNRPDAQHCTRELANHLVKPTVAKYKQLEHLVCYLKGTAGYAVRFEKTTPGTSVLNPSCEEPSQDGDHLVEIFTDSDWGGNRVTRKSVSVGHIYWNGVLIHTLTRTQKAVALSSCEAEYIALTTETSEGIFLRNCTEFLTGRRCQIHLRTMWKARARDERLEALENGNVLLREQAASAEGTIRIMRSELEKLQETVQNYQMTEEDQGPVLVLQTNVPGLRENILQDAQERGIELSFRQGSEENEPGEMSERGSDWYPGQTEDEEYGDNAQWMAEYRNTGL